jgi:nucleoside-diphosphate-sugar epimerase
MKVLITGANGFVGIHLTKRLVREGCAVRAMVQGGQDHPELRHPLIEICSGELLDRSSLCHAMKGVQQVYHLAGLVGDWAPDPRNFYRVNVQGTLNLLEAAKEMGVEKIVATSTVGALGPPDQSNVQPMDELHVRLHDFTLDYEASKFQSDTRMLQYVLQGMNIVIVYPTRIYGPGSVDRKNGYLWLMKTYLNKGLIAYPNVGKALSNLVYIDDIVEGHILAMRNGKAGEKYILGGENASMDDFLETIFAITGKKARRIPLPLWGLRLSARMMAVVAKVNGKQPLLTRKLLEKSKYSWPVSIEKAKRELGYAPHSLEQGVRKSIEWLRENGHLG